MKKLILTLCVSLVSLATVADDPIVAQTLFSDGTTNVWTQADLIAALQLMNRKYHRDCETPSGRRAWHGAVVGQTVDTNALVKTETYADGTVFSFPFASRSVQASNAKLAMPVTTNGVPAKLAAARLRRQAESQGVSNVTVTVTAGEGR